jgi:hypothetical protein
MVVFTSLQPLLPIVQKKNVLNGKSGIAVKMLFN